jgi:hypothetical protein
MVTVLASSVVDRGFAPRSGETKDYTICMLLLLRKARSSKENERQLVGSES